ncbi:MAG: VWA domain-containing protein [Rhodospirillales bacterium 70-18]|nr:VWA domain-containing protein [Rhodospirillales bacterium]OJY73667.1 MAG: VWA domain-containing protein [Rhodospirillales bacterium 70-18]
MAAVEGMLSANIMHFARLLRRAGLPVGPADMLAAQRAMLLVDIGSRVQVRTALRTTMVHRHEHEDLFNQAFLVFWRDPEAAKAAAAMGLLDAQKEMPPERAPPGSRRLAEAFDKKPSPQDKPPPPRQEIDAVLTVSERERLQQMDFEAMSADDIARAKQEIRLLTLPLDLRRTRRLRPDPAGPNTDLRATIRAARRFGGEILSLERSRTVTRPPPLVVLCDISGSMSRYAQILLHFLHAVANDRDRVSVFLFGTRLSNITRQLRHRDAEVAFQMVAHAVPDWSGGTRIGEALAAFNHQWSRRVLGQGAVVLLVTDGLDRPRDGGEGMAGLAENMERLHKSCRRLIWLNPLLRWDGFEPKSQGIRAMLPHVDEFRPVHNLASLRALIQTLSRPSSPREMERWRLAS